MLVQASVTLVFDSITQALLADVVSFAYGTGGSREIPRRDAQSVNGAIAPRLWVLYGQHNRQVRLEYGTSMLRAHPGGEP